MTFHELGENLEQYFIEIIQEKRRGSFDRLTYGFLFLASRFYRRAVQFRLWLYENRVIRNHSIGCLVVSIGNLTCGGTGKTPVVEKKSTSSLTGKAIMSPSLPSPWIRHRWR